MNKAITEGISFMPPPFRDGLDVWARGDGTPGSESYDGNPNAAIVTADADFGSCLELLKTDSVQKLRYMGETPILPGCYLRIRARIKAVSGNLPSARIAAWAGLPGGSHADNLVETGPSVALASYGEVVEVSAIVGTGFRTGVDMPWGLGPVYGHFGIDLTGPDGGVVRIDDIEIEDVTSVFLRDMVPVVDVRDFGARGDGVTDDHAAFVAADAAAAGRRVLVPAGSYFIGADLTMVSEMEFEGTLAMPDEATLLLTRDYSLPAYIDAFGSEELGFRKAFQALLNNVDHDSLDMRGRTVSVSAPIDLAAAVGNVTSFNQRRVIRNGQFYVEGATAWETGVVTSQATYSPADPKRLTGVINVANIEVGSLVEGAGVGREVYVTEINVGAQEVTLSGELHDAAGTQVFTFRRFRYVLDFSGFSSLSKFALSDIEISCNGTASGILLAPKGSVFHIKDCVIDAPRDRGITSHGTGCQGMLVDRCQFLSNEWEKLAQDRVSIALNANANDVKLRNNRSTRLRHFAVLHGANNLVSGNHFFQGDTASAGLRTAGLILTSNAVNTSVVGNYIDNCFIEWTNEGDATPEFTTGFSFAGLSITNNVCFASDVAAWFSFLVVKPHGPGHFLNGLSVTANMFRATQGAIDRIERVDTSHAELDWTRARNVEFRANTFQNVTVHTENPVAAGHGQATPAATWVVGPVEELPFGGRARRVEALVATAPILDPQGAERHVLPHADVARGTAGQEVHLDWGEDVSGEVSLTLRIDT